MDAAQHDLIGLFNQYFEVVRADTKEKEEECFRLRYEVYCKEALIPGFDANDYPNGLERDQYDERSVHCLLVHKPTGSTAGTVRIILPDSKNSQEKFPVEKIAGNFFFRDLVSEDNIPRSQIGEISRLILAPEFRARKGENQKPYGFSENSDLASQQSGRRHFDASRRGDDRRSSVPRRIFPHAVLGLFVAIVRMSLEHNLSYWYGGMEPVCARFLQSFGVDFTPISPVVDYHGLRRSYFGYIPNIMENIYRVNSEVWMLLTNNGTFLSR